jgi:hypothetical protein
METKHINNHNKLVTNCVQNKVVFYKEYHIPCKNQLVTQQFRAHADLAVKSNLQLPP